MAGQIGQQLPVEGDRALDLPGLVQRQGVTEHGVRIETVTHAMGASVRRIAVAEHLPACRMDSACSVRSAALNPGRRLRTVRSVRIDAV